MNIMLHVSELGWGGNVWSEDSLSSKRLYPGHQFPAKSKKWLMRIKTNPETIELAVNRIQGTHVKAPAYLRKKIDSGRVDAISERACAVYYLAEEVLQRVPLDAKCLHAQWTEAWAAGSEHVDTEVQALLLEKSDTLDILTQIPTFKLLMDEHMLNTPVTDKQATDAQTTELEIDRFQLFLKQTVYDVAVFANFKKKCQSCYASRAHAIIEHRIQKRDKCVEAAKKTMRAFVKVTTWEGKKAEHAIAEIMDYKKQLQLKRGIAGASTQDIAPLVYWNNLAPALVPIDVTDKQISVMAWQLAENMRSCAMVLDPAHTYTKGQLHLQQAKFIQTLIQGNHDIDHQFSMIFKEQCDARDRRPLTCFGRLVFPSPAGDPNKSIWASSSLFRTRRTDEIPQLPAREMREAASLIHLTQCWTHIIFVS
jgi:hypothetical protein